MHILNTLSKRLSELGLQTLTFSIVFFSVACAMAYPELTRFGYNNCQACHVSPAGAGTLTSYGRSLSSEILSTWGSEKEAGFLHGAVDREKLESKFLVGGDIRGVQAHMEDQSVKAGRFIKMQSDIGGAVQWGDWTASFTVGAWQDDQWKAKLTNGYLMYRFGEGFSIRMGKFIPQYGLYIRDHIYFIRTALGFGLNSEQETAELQWTGENWLGTLTYARGTAQNRREALSLGVQKYFGEGSKIAANYWREWKDGNSKDLYGAWTILGFTKRFYILAEADYQKQSTATSAQQGYTFFTKTGYTFFKGFDGLILAETFQNDIHNGRSKTTRYGLGWQFFPRPHFEISGAWEKQQILAVSNYWGDYAWLLLHYYF
ncbi:MAG: hypothetical protein H6623_06510 [Bdellovibrionaceae bacterium]|nr:hypothetical protein [Pseudobdellovibrionaceae bacterium]